jgi:hypothetical protein
MLSEASRESGSATEQLNERLPASAADETGKVFERAFKTIVPTRFGRSEKRTRPTKLANKGRS